MSPFDLNKLVPAPKLTTLDPNSNEALIQRILNHVAPNGGTWLEGRHTFWVRLLKGDVFEDAVRAAIDAAVPLKDSAAADKRYAEVMIAEFPTKPQGAVAKAWRRLGDAARSKSSN
jgi:hypothetical protein